MKKIKCKSCGDKVDFDDSNYLEGVGDVCSICYWDSVSACSLCGEYHSDAEWSEFIMVKAELSKTASLPPGIYRIMDYPFLSIPMIGSGSMDRNAVMFLDKLPKPDAHYKISGHICKYCSPEYDAAFKSAYLKDIEWLKANRFKHPNGTWELERAHTRRIILDNPNMLRDLECDADKYGPWDDIRKMYDLSLMPTYHERLLLRRKGVSVYYPDISTDIHWVSLRPEPSYRHRSDPPFSIDPSSLPTWEPPENGYMDNYRQSKAAISALKKAIDLGILTKDGVVK